MSDILRYTANGIRSIAANMNSGEAAIQLAEVVKRNLEARARYIAAREFMYALRGENQQIRNENNKSSLRDKPAQALNATA